MALATQALRPDEIRAPRTLALMGDLTFIHDVNGLLIGAGEPLNPEVVERVQAAWGVPIPQPYMAFTIAEFGHIAIDAMHKLGVRFTDRELDVLRLVAIGLSNGDIGRELFIGEATVKTFKRTEGQVWLLPHNPAYSPIDGNQASILGKVVAVLRRV